MYNFDDWAIAVLEDDGLVEEAYRPEYKYSNKEEWTDSTIRILVCNRLIEMIRDGYNPCDAVVTLQDRMLRNAYIARSQHHKERYMSAYYNCEYYMSIFSEEEWSREENESVRDEF